METTKVNGSLLERQELKETAGKTEPVLRALPSKERKGDKAKMKTDDGSDSKQSKDTRKQLGARGEAVACLYLERQGIEILERNWRCQAGEADIIAREDDEIVFIEVKTRASLSAGLPEDSVTRQKRRKYEGIAIYYLSKADAPSSKVRFDVISITLVNEGRAFLRHHRDAFCSGD